MAPAGWERLLEDRVQEVCFCFGLEAPGSKTSALEKDRKYEKANLGACDGGRKHKVSQFARLGQQAWFEICRAQQQQG